MLKVWRRCGVIALFSLAVAGCAAAGTPGPAPTITPAGTAPENPTIMAPTSTAGPLLERPTDLLNAFLELARGDGDFRVQAMADSGDPSYIPVLVDYLRFSGLLGEDNRNTIIRALFNLSGAAPDELKGSAQFWDWWVRWVGKHSEVQGPEAYAGFKGLLFSQMVDPRQSDFIHGGVDHRIRLEEIVWGGVPRDGIPDLINPRVISPQEAGYLFDEDRVFGVSFNGEHRAYPLRILNAHEMVNDVVGGVPFALAY